MDIHRKESVSGQRLLSVCFERMIPDAAAPTVEVIFEVLLPESVDARFQQPYCIFFASATDTDTRTPIALNPDEKQAAVEAAVDYLAKIDLYNATW